MFSDRLRRVKLALALLAFAGLCRWSEGRVAEADPPVESLPTSGGALLGRAVNVGAKTVTATHPDWIEVLTAAGTIRVLGQTSPAARAGDVLSATGVVTGPREIRADRLRLHPGFGWKRALNYAVSVLTLGLFLLWAVPLLPRTRGLIRSRD